MPSALTAPFVAVMAASFPKHPVETTSPPPWVLVQIGLKRTSFNVVAVIDLARVAAENDDEDVDILI